MALEIERKFLVHHNLWHRLKKPVPVRITQAYLSKDIHKTIRVRLMGHHAFLTVKGKSEGVVRQEFEYEIPVSDARELIDLCEEPPMDKDRFRLQVGDHVWDVDVFYGANEGLILAEIELKTEDEVFEKPGWLASEVSDDIRFYNSNLAQNPFKKWRSNDF